jgi:predicted RNase H-like HicB family nuclease
VVNAGWPIDGPANEEKLKPSTMKTYTAVIERDSVTGMLVGYVPGFPGAHSQGETMEELNDNLREVISMLLEDGEPRMETEFLGTHNVAVA